MTDLLTPSPTHEDLGRRDRPTESIARQLIRRISALELIIGVVIAVVMAVLVAIEPAILEAPFQNVNTLAFTVGGTLLAAGALVAMLWMRVPAPVRIVVLVVPFALVNWWLLSPYFVDDVVDDQFATSIAAQAALPDPEPATVSADSRPETADATEDSVTDVTADPADDGQSPAAPESSAAETEQAPASDATDTATTPGVESQGGVAEAGPTAPPVPAGPVLLGAGQFVGLAGHDGTGDAGIFENPDGSLVLRFENFDIENGPDLEVYLVPGADQTSLPTGSIHLGELKGNVGAQNYELPAGTVLAPGEYTILVWCDAFSVEFVGATVTV